VKSWSCIFASPLHQTYKLFLLVALQAQPAAAAAKQGKAGPKSREQQQQQRPPAGGRPEVQLVKWNPDHKFLHLRNGEPIVPFKELLKGKTGEERKRLLYEIAMDVKEWRRWRHANAVAKAAKRREKQARDLAAGKQTRNYNATPEERWKQKIANKRSKQQGKRLWQGRGRR
jgi:hypothetical protein